MNDYTKQDEQTLNAAFTTETEESEGGSGFGVRHFGEEPIMIDGVLNATHEDVSVFDVLVEADIEAQKWAASLEIEETEGPRIAKKCITPDAMVISKKEVKEQLVGIPWRGADWTRAELIEHFIAIDEMEKQIDELEAEDQTISIWMAGDRELDESSPELAGYEWMRVARNMIEDEGFDRHPEPVKLDGDGQRMLTLSVWAEKRRKLAQHIADQGRVALLRRDGKLIHKWNTAIFTYRDSSWNHRIIRSMEPKPVPFFGSKAERRTYLISLGGEIRDLFEEGRCLNQEQNEELKQLFVKIWAAYRSGKNAIPLPAVKAEPKPVVIIRRKEKAQQAG